MRKTIPLPSLRAYRATQARPVFMVEPLPSITRRDPMPVGMALALLASAGLGFAVVALLMVLL